MTPTMNRRQWVAIYCRISRDGEGSGLGVKRQEKDCRGLIARTWPRKPIKLYVDNDISAFSKTAKRTSYLRMLDDVQGGQVIAVVAWHPDRLHRQPRELEDFIDVIEATGTSIATVSAGDLDLSTATGRMNARVIGAMSRHESERKQERIRRKHLELAQDGRPGGSAGYGYRNGRDRNRRPTFVIETAEAAVIGEMADRILRGESMLSIANDLNKRNVPTARGGIWHTTTIKAVLTKPSIAGLRAHHGEVNDGKWKPILDRRTWDRVCTLIGQRQTVTGSDGGTYHVNRNRSKSREYLLTTGIAVCGECGAAMSAQARKWKSKGTYKKSVYTCPPTTRGGCAKVAIIAPELEDFVARAILTALNTDKVAQALVQQKDDPRTPLLATMAQLQRELDELATMHGENQITAREWLKAREPKEARFNEAQAKLESLPAEITVGTDAATIINEWPNYSLPQKQRVIRLVADKVELLRAKPGTRSFDRDRVKIHWRKPAEGTSRRKAGAARQRSQQSSRRPRR